MKPLELNVILIVISFYIHGPEWIGHRLGDLLLMDYDGQKLPIWPAETDLTVLYCTVKQLEF